MCELLRLELALEDANRRLEDARSNLQWWCDNTSCADSQDEAESLVDEVLSEIRDLEQQLCCEIELWRQDLESYKMQQMDEMDAYMYSFFF
ncbi:MAG: hypothetical protein CL489_10670 [Acidobacteria bacterium]|nr:hypothetical protein [Acidobacteriota bacterium]|tara:strand:- start:1093 stop:1365 length:273 start_codon:yes stop_codon:yes gene_type:complete